MPWALPQIDPHYQKDDTVPLTLVPGQPVPELVFSTLDGKGFDLSKSNADYLTLIEVYRGLHCPRCHRHLLALAGLLPRFADRGIEVVAVSTDPEDRAGAAHEQWGLGQLNVGFGLTEEQARHWGLFLSNPITPNEPRPFAEPGTFFVRPDGVLFAAALGTSPFARSHWPDWLEGLDAAKARNYPPRGDRP